MEGAAVGTMSGEIDCSHFESAGRIVGSEACSSVESNPTNDLLYNPNLEQAETRLKMLEQALTLSSETFKENNRVINVIEDKAQKAAGLAGIFLAAGLSFLR